MKDLDPGYSVEVDSIGKDHWHELMLQFDDAFFYQTWSYGAIHWGENNLSHLILKKEKEVVAMAQARVLKVTGLPIGTAYVNWGPMWKKKGVSNHLDSLRNVVRALYNEYVARRKYLLRMFPRVIETEETQALNEIFADENFLRSDDPLQTVVLDLSLPLDKIRANMRRSWRASLKTAEKKNLEIIEGTGDNILKIVSEMKTEMKDRKGYFGGEQDDYLNAHKDLPEKLKLKISVCIHEGEPVAALGWQSFGKTGTVFVGGTGNKALELKASFLLWWKMIECCKIEGFTAFDVAGVSQERNPGGYFFKTGLVGKNFEKPDCYIGQFEACESKLSQLVFKGIYDLKDAYVNIRRKMAKQQNNSRKKQGK